MGRPEIEDLGRRLFVGGAVMAALACATDALSQTAAQQQLSEDFPPDTEQQRIADLLVANHILADHDVLDSYGHVTVRSLKNPKHYLMSRSRAPRLVQHDDIMEFDEDSQPIDLRGRQIYNERYIHGEIYRVRPDVMSVVHSHSPEVLPFSVTQVPLKALIHVGHFIGADPVPVFDLEDVEGPKNGMLVLNARAGAALARTLGNRTVVLMRGHGMTVVGENIRRAVYNAIYTQLNAKVELEALKLGQPKFLNPYEVQRRGQINRAWEEWSDHAKSDHAKLQR
jgi:ribulose-5-phosphate 4-epimerase/fuculose-1-phosphate aldolase